MMNVSRNWPSGIIGLMSTGRTGPLKRCPTA
jgi:hypothetical protein